MPVVRGEQIATWGDANKANGYFGTDEVSKDAIAGDFKDIPIIDISGAFSSELKDRQEVAEQVRDACVRVGFFYAKGHGVPQDMIDKMFECAEKFFELSYDEKMELFINNQDNYRGYTPLYGSGKPDIDGLASEYPRVATTL
jgi:TPR repeat protein